MVRIPVRASEFFRSQKLPVFPHCVMMDVIFGKIGSFSPNQKSGVCIIEMVAGRIGRKPFKGISVALHHHFWRQKGERRPTTMFIISGNLENTTSQPFSTSSAYHTEFPGKFI